MARRRRVETLSPESLEDFETEVGLADDAPEIPVTASPEVPVEPDPEIRQSPVPELPPLPVPASDEITRMDVQVPMVYRPYSICDTMRLPRSVEVTLTPKQRVVLERMFIALGAEKTVLTNGRNIHKRANVINWLLDNIVLADSAATAKIGQID